MKGSRRTRTLAAFATVSLLGAAVPCHAQDGDPSAWTRDQQAAFLREAEVVDRQRLDVGVTRSFRLRLRRDGIEHDAHWQTVDETLTSTKIGGRIYQDFKDSYLFNVAAYEIDRLLGLEMVPVTVLRKVKGRGTGAMAWWVDDVQMMERDRVENNVFPPDPERWQGQMARYACFQQLIANIDANATNILYTSDWRMWLIDFTRAFRTNVTLMDTPKLRPVGADLRAALERLDKKELRRVLRDVLTGAEINALLRRRDRIVAELDQTAQK